MPWKDTHTPLRIALARPWPTTLRGLVLWLFALGLAVLGGVNYVLTPIPAVTAQGIVALRVAPAPFWGSVMLAVAAVCIWSSYCHHGRDRIGFTLYSLTCCMWGLQFVAGYLVEGASARALGSATVWVLFGVGMAAVAGLPNTPLRTKDRPGEVLR